MACTRRLHLPSCVKGSKTAGGGGAGNECAGGRRPGGLRQRRAHLHRGHAPNRHVGELQNRVDEALTAKNAAGVAGAVTSGRSPSSGAMQRSTLTSRPTPSERQLS